LRVASLIADKAATANCSQRLTHRTFADGQPRTSHPRAINSNACHSERLGGPEGQRLDPQHLGGDQQGALREGLCLLDRTTLAVALFYRCKAQARLASLGLSA
jgi:hypothetical protein